LGLTQARAQEKEDDIDAQPDSTVNQRPTQLQPVNVADMQRLAEAKLPKATFDYITTGSADQITLRENIAAFRRLRVYPPLMKGVSNADLATTALGQDLKLPIMLAPVAVQRMYHVQGGLAAARAAASAGTVYGVSSSVGNSVEEIARASNGPKWFQLYVPKDRAITRRLVQRVERAGYAAIIVTVDLGEWKDADRRNRFALPKEMLVKHLRDVGFDQITDKMSYQEVVNFNIDAWDLSLSWKFFDWLRGVTKLPLLIKGVLRPEDARKAVSIGIDGIIVSNHGGRRLDGMPATIDVLPSVIQAVHGRCEVFLDGGIRRGTDVLKALALGAQAVLIGRPYAWALAADGEAGVAKVLDLFREELSNAMVATGCAKISDIESSLIA
jgi:4-hydroxymandelate oxidase